MANDKGFSDMKDKEEICGNPICDREERYRDGYCKACHSALMVGKERVKHEVKVALHGS